MNLNELEILEDEFDLFVALDDKQKIEFLFDALEEGMEASVLKQVEKLASVVPRKENIIHVEDLEVGPGIRLAITFTKNEVHLNCAKLRPINRFVTKLFNDGLLLQRLKDTKKGVFDHYRYFKAYKIIARFQPLSSN